MWTRAIAAILLSVPAFTWAACSPSSSLGGKWQFFKTWRDGTGSQHADSCTFVLGADGTITRGSCRSIQPDGTLLKPYTTSVSGQIAVTSACVVSGTVTTIVNDEGIKLVTGRMEIGHGLINGIAADIDYFGGTYVGNLSSFTMTRY